ncbi:MAG: hypothetical protein GY739_01620 [Mesoflavibacter sp.]|nr:hypothetical protein [Mesoflavibacter sp.]
MDTRILPSIYRVASLLQTRLYKKTSCILKKFVEKCSTRKIDQSID